MLTEVRLEAKVMRHYKQLEAELSAAHTEAERVTTLVTLVEWLASTNPWAARPRAVEALAAAQRVGDQKLIARTYRAHANSLLHTRGPREAFDELVQARRLSASIHDVHGLAWCDYLLGSALEFLGDPGGATIRLERALGTFREVEDLVGQDRTLTALGNGEQYCGRFGDALDKHLEAKDFAIKADDVVGINIATLNCGQAKAHLGVIAAQTSHMDIARDHFNSALTDFRSVLAQAQAIEDVSNEPIALARQVLPLCWLGEHEAAVAVAQQALTRGGELRLDHRLAIALQAAGMAYVVVGELAQAIGYLRRALALYSQWDLTHDTVSVLRLLVEAYDRSGDVAAALNTHKQLLSAELRLRDKLTERDDQIAVARLEVERTEQVTPGDQIRLAQLARVNRRLENERRAMERLAHTDALTGLANRRHCDAQLTRSLIQAELTNSPLSVILVDIDHFKKINDQYSHLVGDEVLRTVAFELTRHCRTSDLACRIGGEEFAILLPATALENAVAVAERLRTSVAALDLSQITADLQVTISAGVASTFGGLATDLMAAADKLLYQAKQSGRNCVFPAAPGSDRA